jgi:hypothetical protein
MFGIIILLFSSVSLFALQLVNIQKPPEYVRQDHLMTLRSNVGTIKVNCFDFPGVFLSAYFVYRIAETQGRILLKKDLLVCDFDYSLLNRTTVVVNSTIWFMNPDASDLTEKELHLDQTGEQIGFPMVQPGNYMFDIWIVRSPCTVGWEENFFPDIKFYVYESPDAYFSAMNTYHFSLLTSGLSFFGTITGLMLAVVGEGPGSGKEQQPKEAKGAQTKVDENTETGSHELEKWSLSPHTMKRMTKRHSTMKGRKRKPNHTKSSR